MLAAGELSQSDSAWVEGTQDWMPLAQLLNGLAASEAVKPESKLRVAGKVLAGLAVVAALSVGVWAIVGGDKDKGADPEEKADNTGDNPGSRSPAPSKNETANLPLPDYEGLAKLGTIVKFDSASFGSKKGLAVLSAGPDTGLVAMANLVVCRDGKVLGRMKVTRVQGGQSVAVAVNPLDPESLRVGDEIALDVSMGAGSRPAEKIELLRHLPDDPGMMMSLKLGEMMELLRRHAIMRNVYQQVYRLPLFGSIMRGVQQGDFQVSKTNPAFCWVKPLPSSSAGEDPNLLVCIVLPIDAGLLELESVIRDELESRGQQVSKEKAQGYAILKNLNSPAGLMAFGNGRFVIASIIDSANQPLPPRQFMGAGGQTLTQRLNDALDLAFNGRQEPGTSIALLDFAQNSNDAAIYMDYSQLPVAMMADDPNSEAALEVLSETPLAFGVNFEPGSVALNMAVYHEGFQASKNRLGDDLLQRIPLDSMAMAGASVDMKSAAVFYKNVLIPQIRKMATSPDDIAQMETGLALVKSITGKSIPELMGLLKGDVVLGWADLEAPAANPGQQPGPKGVLGLACASPEAADDLLTAFRSAGGPALMKEIGLEVVQKENQLFLCSASYRQALEEGKPLNDGTDPRLKPLAENGLAMVATADDLIQFAKLFEAPQEALDLLGLVDQFSLTGNFEKGKQSYQFQCLLQDNRKHGLLALAELAVPTGTVPRGRLMGNGTGFFITEDGLLVTNYHVVEHGASFTVKVESGKELPAELVKLNRANDLALLKVKGDFSPLPVRNSNESELGDPVLTMGFPAINVQGREPKLTEGMISSLKGMRDDKRFFQISVPVQPGNSGGALVDEFGNVVGVVTARLNDEAVGFVAQNVNYAVKSSVLISFLKNVPDLSAKLHNPFGKNDKRTKRDVIRAVKEAKVLVLVYGR